MSDTLASTYENIFSKLAFPIEHISTLYVLFLHFYVHNYVSYYTFMYILMYICTYLCT